MNIYIIYINHHYNYNYNGVWNLIDDNEAEQKVFLILMDKPGISGRLTNTYVKNMKH